MPLLFLSSHMIYLLPEFPLEETAVAPSFREVLKDALRPDDDGDPDECIARIWGAMAKGTRARRNLPHSSYPGLSLWGRRGTLVVAKDFRFYPYVRIGMERCRGPTEETRFLLNSPAGYLESKPGTNGWIFSQELDDDNSTYYGRPDDLYIYFTLAHGFWPFSRREKLMQKAALVRTALADVMNVAPVELAWRGLEDEEKFARSVKQRLSRQPPQGRP